MNNTDLQREFATIQAMLVIYCKDHHHFSGKLCSDCKELSTYAKKRLNHCPFREQKPTCGNCSVHCYKAEMRDKVKIVMKYAGPRMIYKHPVMALRHLLQSKFRPAQQLQKESSNPKD